MGKFVDLSGQKFGKLTVVKRATFNNSEGKPMWDCVCDCNPNEHIFCYGSNLKTGKIVSCGCQKIENCKSRSTHNMSQTTTYKIWKSMKRRCHNPQATNYKDYGARGIAVCDRWFNSFENFLADMGERPSKEYSIERKDGNKNYEPDNCIWATSTEQNRNKKNNFNLTLNGETKCVAEWAEITGLDRNTIVKRKKHGQSDEEALLVKSQLLNGHDPATCD
jgi:hypothetical protein